MIGIETHPFVPFMPRDARLLMLGTFPPARKRWCMEFYYPNFQNDMWRIFGYIYFDDKNHFVVQGKRTFDVAALKAFLTAKRVAISDTALRVRRTKNTASDKDLEIVESSDLDALLYSLPECRGVLTAGQLATNVFTKHYGIAVPAMGGYTEFPFEGRNLRLYRMPSSSRAYPMRVEDKAKRYRIMFNDILE